MRLKKDIPGTLNNEGDDFDNEPEIVYESIGDVPQDSALADLDSPPQQTSRDCDRPFWETIMISVLLYSRSYWFNLLQGFFEYYLVASEATKNVYEVIHWCGSDIASNQVELRSDIF
jgi:hypothetical protein